MGVAVNILATLGWSPGDGTEVPAVVVYVVLAGAGFAIVLFTGVLAWWMSRRERRQRRDRRTPVPRPRTPAAPRPAEVDAGGTNGREPDPSGEYVLLRAATARAATVAVQAHHSSVEAASDLTTAERIYDEARRANGGSPAARGQAAEVHARQQYHIALARARAARQAEYVADTALRALGAETAAAAAELAGTAGPPAATGKGNANGNGNGNGNGNSADGNGDGNGTPRPRRWRRPTAGVAQ